MKTFIKTFIILNIAFSLFNVKSFGWNSPALSSPANGTNVWTGVTLDWNSVASSQFYQVQADTTNTFNSPALVSAIKTYINSSSGNTDTEHSFGNLFFGKTYYWRVRAYISGDTSAWTVQTFNTVDYVTLNTPTSGSNNWTGITLDWLAHSGVSFYDVQADTTNTFNSPALLSASKTYINSSSGNTDTEHSFGNLFFGKTYYWRVRARNAVDTSAWTTGSFNTVDYVTLNTPTSGSNNWTGVTLDWLAHSGVSFYDVQADTTNTFNSPALLSASKTYINSSSGNSDTEHSFGNLFFGKTYYWRVRARNTVDTSAWTTGSFNTVDYVTLNTPTSGSNNWTGVTLDWLAHTGVSFYDVQADTTNTFNSPALLSASKTYINSSSGNSDTEHSFGNLFFGKTYYWRVRARNAVDTSAWTTGSFNTIDYVTLNTPTSGSNNWTGVTLDWLAHSGVSFYDVQADTTNTFNSPALLSASKTYINSSSGNSDTEHSFGNLFFGKTYYWRLRARNAVDTSAWTIGSFNTVDYVTLVLPNNGQLNVSTTGITLDWNAHTGIGIYQLEIDTVNLFNSSFLITVNKAYINSSSGNTDTQFGTGVLLTNHVYYWRVRAINSVDTSAWTNRVFSTGNCIPPDQPLAINGNTTVCSGSLNTYNITAVSGATSYSWTLPNGWTGSSATTTINATTGSLSGNITVIANNSCASSTAQTINVIVNTVDTSVSQSGVVLTANATGAGYQWINCNGNTLISGQTNQSYTATANGNYAVIVTQAGCSDTSACYNITSIGIDESAYISAISVFPNPSNGKFMLEVTNNIREDACLEIFNVMGEKVYATCNLKHQTSNEIDLTKALKGVYFIKIYVQEKIYIKKIIVQ